MLTPVADTVTTPGSSAGSDSAVVADLAGDGRIGRPVRADVVGCGMAEVLCLIAGRGYDQHTALLSVTSSALQLLQDGPLLSLTLAVVEVGVGEQAQIHHIELLVTGVAQSAAATESAKQ